jgi:hypothetical protein
MSILVSEEGDFRDTHRLRTQAITGWTEGRSARYETSSALCIAK